jgi:heme A synthase
MKVRPSQLDDPQYASFAWERYKRLMRWMALASLIAVVVGLGVLRYFTGPIPVLMMVFTAGGIFFSVLLAAALMGLVFLSSGSGHDEAIDDPFEDQPR